MKAHFQIACHLKAPEGRRTRVPGMGMNYQDERNLTEPMAVTVAERQGRSREGQAERSCKRRGERRNTNGQRGRVRATSWRVTAKSQGHQDASGRVRRHAPKVHDLTRGDLRRESAGEVSKDRSSVEAVRKHCGAKGRRTERLEEESGEGVVRNEDRRGRGNCGHYPPRLLGGPAVQPLQPPRARSKTPFSASFPNARLEVQPPDAENRTSGGVGGVAGAIPPPRPDPPKTCALPSARMFQAFQFGAPIFNRLSGSSRP